MKLYIKIWLMLCLFSCSVHQPETGDKNDNKSYLIKKIVSKNDWLVVYAEKQDSLFKIVVGNESSQPNNCKKIKVGETYFLNLKSRRKNAPEIGGVKLNPINYLDIECFAYDENTEICIEPEKGIYDLYYTFNLKGYCYVPLAPRLRTKK
jgi:hypothetical protein